VPPIEAALLRHAYDWLASALTFDVVVDIDPAGSLGASSLGKEGDLILVSRSSADVEWGHLADDRDPGHTRVLGTPAATGLESDQADLLVWAPAALHLPTGWQPVLAEARRVLRPAGLVALIVDDAGARDAANAAEELGFPTSVRVDHRPLIGSAIGWTGSASLDGQDEPTGSGAILLLGPTDMPSLDSDSSILIEPGQRALRLELSGQVPTSPAGEDPAQTNGSPPQPSPPAVAPVDEDQAALQRRVSRSEDRAARAERHAASVVRTLATIEARAAADRARAARLAMAVEEARQHVEMITSSPSWRLTAPLRRLKGQMRS